MTAEGRLNQGVQGAQPSGMCARNITDRRERCRINIEEQSWIMESGQGIGRERVVGEPWAAVVWMLPLRVALLHADNHTSLTQ